MNSNSTVTTHTMHLRATESSPEMAGSRTLRFIASDETPDRMGDIIQVSGWNLSSYKKNPVVLWGHDTSSVPPIGRAVNVRRGRKANGQPALYANIEFAPEEAHPFAETVYQLAKRGYLNAVSVGFLPRKTKDLSDQERSRLGMPPYGQMYSEADLMEISVVSVPANPSALISQARGLVSDNVLGAGQVERFLDHVREQEAQSLSDRLKSKIRGFIDLNAEQRSDTEAQERSPACRQTGESTADCVERKIPELIEEGMEQDQATAVAHSVCETPCENTKDAEATEPVLKHVARVEETEEAYIITYLKPGYMELSPDANRGMHDDEDEDKMGHEDDEDEDKMGHEDDEDEDKKKRRKRKPRKGASDLDYTLGALIEAQAEQARAMTTLTDSIGDLTKRLDLAVGGVRAGVQTPEAPAPAPTQQVPVEEIEQAFRSATNDLLTRFQSRSK